MKRSYETPRAALFALLAMDVIAASGNPDPNAGDPAVDDPDNW